MCLVNFYLTALFHGFGKNLHDDMTIMHHDK